MTGRVASGVALAPQLLRATGVGPEVLRIIGSSFFPLFPPFSPFLPFFHPFQRFCDRTSHFEIRLHSLSDLRLRRRPISKTLERVPDHCSKVEREV